MPPVALGFPSAISSMCSFNASGSARPGLARGIAIPHGKIAGLKASSASLQGSPSRSTSRRSTARRSTSFFYLLALGYAIITWGRSRSNITAIETLIRTSPSLSHLLLSAT